MRQPINNTTGHPLGHPMGCPMDRVGLRLWTGLIYYMVFWFV